MSTKTQQLMKKYPSKIPISICFPDNEKKKLFFPKDIRVVDVQMFIRKKYFPKSYTHSIIISVGDTIICGTDYLCAIYEQYKNRNDQILYMTIFFESTFGNI